MSFPPSQTATAPAARRPSNLRIWWPIAGFLVGFAFTYYVWRQGVSLRVAEYLSLAVLAGLDSVFGGIRAGVERRFRSDVFLSGFLVNMILSVLLVYIGQEIGVGDLYLAAVVTLGGRIFINLSVIRRHLLERHPIRGEK